MAEHVTHFAEANEASKLASMLGRAFLDDPVQIYLFPDESTRLQKVERLFGSFLRGHYLKHGATSATKNHEGVALWAPSWALHLYARRDLVPSSTNASEFWFRGAASTEGARHN